MFCNQGRSATGWRPLHKPQWYSVLKKRRNNIATAMELFQGMLPPPPPSPSQILFVKHMRKCMFGTNFRDASDVRYNCTNWYLASLPRARMRNRVTVISLIGRLICLSIYCARVSDRDYFVFNFAYVRHIRMQKWRWNHHVVFFCFYWLDLFCLISVDFF